MSNFQSRSNAQSLDVRQEITDSIIECLENGTMPWRSQRSEIQFKLPQNLKSSSFYHGINTIRLWAQAKGKGYRSPFWATYQQVADMGGNVKKGEKATRIVFFKELPQKADSNKREGEMSTRELEDSRFVMKAFCVFNLEQCENLKATSQLEEEIAAENERTLKGEIDHRRRIQLEENLARTAQLIDSTGAQISTNPGTPCYEYKNDKIQIPSAGSFENSESYFATLLHELAHWTSHPSRLDRKVTGNVKLPDYAKEELIAELAAAFLCGELGILNDLQNHASYLDFWIKTLKEDKTAIFKAAGAASKAANFILALEKKESKAA